MPDFFNKYPYTDFHELNLDWTLDTVKETKKAVDQNTSDIEQFTEDITEQQETFEHDMTEWKNGVDRDLADWKHDTEGDISSWENGVVNGLDLWKENTRTTFQGQIDGMENEWDQFLDDYTQQGAVTQSPYGDNVLQVTSQKAVNDSMTRYNGTNNLLFTATPHYNYYNRGDQAPQANNNYTYFDIELTAGTTYYFNHPARFVGSVNTMHGEELSSFTPSSTGTYWITFRNSEEWKVATSNDFTNISGFKSPSFSANQLMQNYGSDDSIPVSQKGIDTIFKTKVDFAINNSIGGSHYNLVYDANEIILNKYYNGTNYSNDNNYSVIKLNLTGGTTYYFHANARFVCTNGVRLAEDLASYTPATTGEYIITLFNNSSILGNASSDMIITTSSDLSKVPPYNCPEFVSSNLHQTVGSDTKRPMSQKAVTDALSAIGTPYLSGKKWCACGDSFTKGDFTGASDYTFTDDPYNGENKVYPYYIGRRCQMNVVMLAEGGMTMAVRDGSSNNFSGSLYQSIPADSDYITFKFGINDQGYSIPIGTINDAVNTTFYGAWNIVLSWVITNRPLAKLGMIITNGLSADAAGKAYADAAIAIAEKYGIPYINEYDGKQVPLMIRSGRTDVPSAIRDARTETFRVGGGNYHPNVIAHEYESVFIESWLKTL